MVIENIEFKAAIKIPTGNTLTRDVMQYLGVVIIGEV